MKLIFKKRLDNLCMCVNDSMRKVGTVEKLIDSVNRCNVVEVFLRFYASGLFAYKNITCSL